VCVVLWLNFLGSGAECNFKYCHDFEWLSTELWLDTGLIDHFNTRLVTTADYRTIADLHTLQTTTVDNKSFQSAFTSRFPVTDLNNGDSSTAPTNSSLHRFHYNSLTSKLVPLVTPWHKSCKNHSLFLYSNRFLGYMFVGEDVPYLRLRILVY
jgi:hypothetical protein